MIAGAVGDASNADGSDVPGSSGVGAEAPSDAVCMLEASPSLEGEGARRAGSVDTVPGGE